MTAPMLDGKDPGRVITIIDNIGLKLTATETQIASLEETLKIFLKSDLREDGVSNGDLMSPRNHSPLLLRLEDIYDRIESLNIQLAQLQSRIDV